MVLFNWSLLVISLILIPNVFCEHEDSHNTKLLERSPRSIGGIFKRLFGRRKQTGFQGTAQAQQDYNSQSSSYYPSYYSNYYPYNLFYGNGYGQYPAGVNSAYNQGYGGYPQAAVAYPSYAASPFAANSQGSNSAGGVDFHSVLDQFVKSAGIAPASGGDQDTSASTIQSKGDTPVFSFKRLYSFPFYLSTDGSSQDGYNLQVPYLKKHISRMAQDYVQRQQQLQQLQKHPQALQYYPIKANDQQLKQMQLLEQQLAYNPHAFISQYLQQLYGQQQTDVQQQQQQQPNQQTSQPVATQPQNTQQQPVSKAQPQTYDIGTPDGQEGSESQSKPAYFYKKSSVNQPSASHTSSAVQVQSSYAAH